MRIKKAGGKVFGAVLTAAEKKAMDMEINRQIVKADRRYADDIDAMVLYTLHVHLGFGKKRLRKFYDAFSAEHDRLIQYYQMPDDYTWLCKEMLKRISTYKTYLMMKADSGETWSKLVDIKEFPDLGGEPEMLETTTLSDNMQTYIAGIQSLDGLSFTANYTLADYKKLKALEGQKKSYAVWFGGTDNSGTVTPDGSNGKFSFDGELSVYPVGAGVNEVVDMNITIAPSTPIAFAES